MQFKPYRVNVNQEALVTLLNVVIRNMDATSSDPQEQKLLAAKKTIEKNIQWSIENGCPVCGRAGMGNDGDAWDPSDVCIACSGTGIIPR